MINKYNIPNFNDLKPKEIIMVNKKIQQSKYYNPDIESKPTEERFDKAFNMFKADEYLYSKHYKVLLFYLNEIEKQNYFDKLYNSFKSRINSFKSYKGFVRPLASYIYNYYNSSVNIDSVYYLLRIMVANLKDSERYDNIKAISLKNDIDKDFLCDIKYQFYNVKDDNEIDEILKKVFMSRSDKFYLECMVKFIINNHLNKDLIEEFKEAIGRMDLETKKEVFVGILEIYVDEKDIDKYPKVWFTMILEHLGEPYSQVNTKWNGIDDRLKEIFRLWNNNENIYNFFINEATDGDKQRLNFWKQYINSIYRIRYYPNLNKALVMEFKNHLFVEFAQHSNALYYYDKQVKNIDMIDAYQSQRYGELSINYLKNKYLGSRKLHSGAWTFNFEQELRRLNYNKGGW
nr:EH signature domain-containing protein [uncultured Romboutsia sp.]